MTFTHEGNKTYFSVIREKIFNSVFYFDNDFLNFDNGGQRNRRCLSSAKFCHVRMHTECDRRRTLRLRPEMPNYEEHIFLNVTTDEKITTGGC